MIWIFFLSAFALFIGLVHFAEDTYSSYLGVAHLERVFGLKPANYRITYFTMSVAPQVGQVIFGYMWMINRRKNWWAGVVALMFFGVDFIADMQDRSNGLLFPVDGSSPFDHLNALLLSAGLTFGYFTIGSELFITAGAGLVLELFSDAMIQMARLYANARKVMIETRLRIRRALDQG